MWIVRKSPTDSEADQLLELGGLKLAERLKGLHQDDLELQKSAKELMKMLRLCGNQSSSALQFVVSRGLREVLLAPVGRVYQRDVVSEFGPKTWPRCRDSETHNLTPTQACTRTGT